MYDRSEPQSCLCITIGVLLPSDTAAELQTLLTDCARAGRAQLSAAIEALGGELANRGDVRITTARQEIGT